MTSENYGIMPYQNYQQSPGNFFYNPTPIHSAPPIFNMNQSIISTPNRINTPAILLVNNELSQQVKRCSYMEIIDSVTGNTLICDVSQLVGYNNDLVIDMKTVHPISNQNSPWIVTPNSIHSSPMNVFQTPPQFSAITDIGV